MPSAANLPFTSFPTDYSALPTVSVVVPNLNNDMHDGTIAAGDTWLQNNLGGYATWAGTHNSLLIVTWDEDDFTDTNHIPTIFVGQMVTAGNYSENINHYNVLRTVEDMYGLDHIANEANAAPIADVWTNFGTSLPPGWSATDVGSPGRVGSTSFDGTTWTVHGGGADIWSSPDQFQYAYRAVAGDSTIVARVTAVQNTSYWAKAGVMFRDGTAANAPYVAVLQNPNDQVEFQWRDVAGADSDWNGSQVGDTTHAKWVQLVRSGDTFSASYATTSGVPTSSDWVLIASHALALSAPTAGLAVTAQDNTALTTATFAGVSVTGTRVTPVTRFAQIGDYGLDGPDERAVADLVHSWNPDFITTTGDNNYQFGAASTIDANIGKYYHDYIAPYQGSYGAGAPTNKFYPSLGFHDWGYAYPNLTGDQPYLNYFAGLPGNRRYYDVAVGLVHLFVLDSDQNEPDGNTSTSVQAQWLQSRLAAATEPYKIVVEHDPPYSSGYLGNGGYASLRWPFQAWGATAVLSGRYHDYERLLGDTGFPYFVDGLGGEEITPLYQTVGGSQVRYNGGYGAMLVEATAADITFRFITVTGQVIDSYTVANPLR